MTPAEVEIRATHAQSYLMVADLVASDDSIDSGPNLVGSLAVLAGIAASDAICGHSLRKRAAGESHGDAISLLKQAAPPGSQAPARLARLLKDKTDTQYSALLITERKARELLTAAQRLVDEMGSLLRA